MATNKSSVWLITGVSQGLGLELARAVLKRGDAVFGTSRSPQRAVDELGGEQEKLRVVSMDLRCSESVAAAVDDAVSKFGRIDVLVNNAGYGLIGAVEEAAENEIRDLFEINVFGLLRVTRAVLPQMRKQRSGHVVNLSSIAGIAALPGCGMYNASKFAVEGLSEALAMESAHLGIRVTIVEPGPFRTNFLGDSLRTAKKVVDDYAQTVGAMRTEFVARNGKQSGDPVLAAEAIIKAVLADKPPLHLLLGAMAFERAAAKLGNLRQDMEDWREVCYATDLPTAGQ